MANQRRHVDGGAGALYCTQITIDAGPVHVERGVVAKNEVRDIVRIDQRRWRVAAVTHNFSGHALRNGRACARIHEQGRVSCDLGQSGPIRCNHWHAGCHRFEHGDTESLIE